MLAPWRPAEAEDRTPLVWSLARTHLSVSPVKAESRGGGLGQDVPGGHDSGRAALGRTWGPGWGPRCLLVEPTDFRTGFIYFLWHLKIPREVYFENLTVWLWMQDFLFLRKHCRSVQRSARASHHFLNWTSEFASTSPKVEGCRNTAGVSAGFL